MSLRASTKVAFNVSTLNLMPNRQKFDEKLVNVGTNKGSGK